MRRLIENYSLEFITVLLLLTLFEVIMFGYNSLGFYDFNDLFLHR